MIEWIVSSSILITVIIALRHILKGRVNLRLQYALWGIVLLRLLIPFSIGSSSLSVINLSNIVKEQPAAETLLAFGQLNIPTQSFESAYGQVVQAYESRGVDVSALEGSELEALDYEAYSLMNGPSISELLKTALLYVWITGAVTVGVCLVFTNLRFSIRLKRARQPLNISGCTLSVYIAPGIETPCLHGLIHPKIYVTPEAAESERILRHVLEHETMHYRHGDHVWSVLRGVCLAIHWYNPLVWRAAILSRRDSELACDESTISRIGENERADYGRTLIGMTCQKRTELLLTATTMTGSRGSIKERITLIAKKPKMAIYTLVAVILIAAIAVGCTFTGEKNSDDVTLYDCNGLSVAIPSAHIDQLIIHIWDELEDDMTLISVYEKASVESAVADGIDDTGLGWLFSIIRYDRVQYEQYLCADGSGLYFFAKNDEWYYGESHATDVRYYRTGDKYFDEDERSQWDALNVLAVSILYDFVERNDLTSYSDDEARLEYTYGGNHQLLNYYPYYSVNGSKDEVFTLVLSQPATQGEDGIWCVERMTDGYGNGYLWFPDAGMPALDYYAVVQAEHDEEKRSDHADIYSAATTFLEESGYFNSAVIEGSLELVSDAEEWSDTDVTRWESEVSLVGFSIPIDGYSNYDEIGYTWAEEFVKQYVENTSEDSPLHSTNAALLTSEIYAESLINYPKTIVYNMRFVCEASDAKEFERWFVGWAGPLNDAEHPQYEGWMEFGWFIVLENDQRDGRWRCTDAGTGGYGGWGYLNCAESGAFVYLEELISDSESVLPESVLRSLPLVDWREFDTEWSAEGWNALWKMLNDYCLTEGQVYGPEETRMWSDVYPDDQAYRNLYVMLTALNTDGAYSEGIASILLKQKNYDTKIFDFCLEQLTTGQRGIINMLVETVS